MAEHKTESARFSVEEADGWTECGCPDSLCPHAEGMRPYRAWTVWDNERDEHAYITVGGVEHEYLRKRPALADAKRLNGASFGGPT
jgi:hypothetical protein